MPELPEVEVSRQGIEPGLVGQTISEIVVRTAKLRWAGTRSDSSNTWAYYSQRNASCEISVYQYGCRQCDFAFGDDGVFTGILHNLRRLKNTTISILTLATVNVCVLNDARKFGACLWQGIDDEPHVLLSALGPEPLTDDFTQDHLHARAQGRTCTVKQFVMDNKNVVGVGNILCQ